MTFSEGERLDGSWDRGGYRDVVDGMELGIPLPGVTR